MRTVACLFLLASLAVKTIAQDRVLEPATIEVHYRHTMQRDTVRRLAMEMDSMILRIGASASQFFSRHTFYYDSLWNDPDGRTKAEALTLEAFRTRDHSKEPRVGTTYDYLYKNYPAGRVTTTNEQFHVACRYDEATPSISWGMADSVRMILGHPCRMATADFRGRHWTAWFATDIPVSDGPWKLGGLPGLILEAYDQGDDYHYTAVRIVESGLDPVTFYCFDGKPFFDTDRLTFLHSQRAFLSGQGNVYDIELIRAIVQSGRRKTYMQREAHRLLFDPLERDY